MLLKNSNKVLKYNGSLLNINEYDPYNPLNLPPYTIRLKFNTGVIPTFENWAGTPIPGTQVSEEPNIWDLTYNDSDWQALLYGQSDLIEVLGANTTNVTNIKKMFKDCISLSSVNIFDTSNINKMRELYFDCYSLINAPSLNVSNVNDLGSLYVNCYSLTSIPYIDTRNAKNIDYICFNCSALKEVPLLDTTNVFDCSHAFQGCVNVESGALALYQQASTQANIPYYHNETFRNCGINTTAGAAELAQIPNGWK